VPLLIAFEKKNQVGLNTADVVNGERSCFDVMQKKYGSAILSNFLNVHHSFILRAGEAWPWIPAVTLRLSHKILHSQYTTCGMDAEGILISGSVHRGAGYDRGLYYGA
jgi:hypothetical protein